MTFASQRRWQNANEAPDWHNAVDARVLLTRRMLWRQSYSRRWKMRLGTSSMPRPAQQIKQRHHHGQSVNGAPLRP